MSKQILQTALLLTLGAFMAIPEARAEETHPHHPNYRVYKRRKVVIVRPAPPPPRPSSEARPTIESAPWLASGTIRNCWRPPGPALPIRAFPRRPGPSLRLAP